MTPIHISTTALEVTILPRGAALASVRFSEAPRNLVLGFADVDDHLNIPIYAGALVGPIANRVSGGRVRIADQIYQMERNENGRTTLHSGRAGIHARIWDVHAQIPDQAILTTTLVDGEGGLPGRREMTAIYTLSGSTLRLEITARTDRATPMNIAAHPYWNLDGGNDIAQHRLQVSAQHYTPTDAHNIPTGMIQETTGTLYDFHAPRPVPLDPALDANLCLGRSSRAEPTHAATLTGSDGTQLDIATTAPGLQVYNGAHLPALSGVLDSGGDLRPYGGIALEPQFWPDAPNIPAFPQITLQPDSLWLQITTYRLTAPS